VHKKFTRASKYDFTSNGNRTSLKYILKYTLADCGQPLSKNETVVLNKYGDFIKQFFDGKTTLQCPSSTKKSTTTWFSLNQRKNPKCTKCKQPFARHLLEDTDLQTVDTMAALLSHSSSGTDEETTKRSYEKMSNCTLHELIHSLSTYIKHNNTIYIHPDQSQIETLENHLNNPQISNEKSSLKSEERTFLEEWIANNKMVHDNFDFDPQTKDRTIHERIRLYNKFANSQKTPGVFERMTENIPDKIKGMLTSNPNLLYKPTSFLFSPINTFNYDELKFEPNSAMSDNQNNKNERLIKFRPWSKIQGSEDTRGRRLADADRHGRPPRLSQNRQEDLQQEDLQDLPRLSPVLQQDLQQYRQQDLQRGTTRSRASLQQDLQQYRQQDLQRGTTRSRASLQRDLSRGGTNSPPAIEAKISAYLNVFKSTPVGDITTTSSPEDESPEKDFPSNVVERVFNIRQNYPPYYSNLLETIMSFGNVNSCVCFGPTGSSKTHPIKWHNILSYYYLEKSNNIFDGELLLPHQSETDTDWELQSLPRIIANTRKQIKCKLPDKKPSRFETAIGTYKRIVSNRSASAEKYPMIFTTPFTFSQDTDDNIKKSKAFANIDIYEYYMHILYGYAQKQESPDNNTLDIAKQMCCYYNRCLQHAIYLKPYVDNLKAKTTSRKFWVGTVKRREGGGGGGGAIVRHGVRVSRVREQAPRLHKKTVRRRRGGGEGDETPSLHQQRQSRRNCAHDASTPRSRRQQHPPLSRRSSQSRRSRRR
jgi:hypothetical protein